MTGLSEGRTARTGNRDAYLVLVIAVIVFLLFFLSLYKLHGALVDATFDIFLLTILILLGKSTARDKPILIGSSCTKRPKLL